MKFTKYFFALVVLSAAPVVCAGTIVVNNDEWTTTNTGFTQAGSGPTTTFLLNLADFLTGGGTGNFLVLE